MADIISIRRISELIRDVEDGTLTLKPYFQRRLVWTSIVKDKFLETVMLGLPFPEIFIATGELDTRTMNRKNLLVDGQQRISTLREYVQGSKDLALTTVKPYSELSQDEKMAFLEYKVAVRDLGTVTDQQIREIFSRINSTDYALKAIERLNAQFNGAYIQFNETLALRSFFDAHNVFSLVDRRRMRDLDFCIILTTTLLSTYYHRDALNKEYLQRYNDEFPQADDLELELNSVFDFIENCAFDKKCRIWKKTDLFTLIVEIYALLIQKKELLDIASVKAKLEDFYTQVNHLYKSGGTEEDLQEQSPDPSVFRYLKAATKATNDKYARVDRAEVISEILLSTLQKGTKKVPATPKKNKASKDKDEK